MAYVVTNTTLFYCDIISTESRPDFHNFRILKALISKGTQTKSLGPGLLSFA